jgi:N-acetylglucosamine-6-phosphate deacetylase
MLNAPARGFSLSTNEDVSVEFDAVINHVEPVLGSQKESQACGTYLAPAFIDLQVNGFAGVDYNSPEAPFDEIARSVDVMFATGVARFFPTVITGGPEPMMGALRNLARAKEELGVRGQAMEAFHVEGPYISAEDGPRGAHPREWARRPDLDEFKRYQEAAQGHIRLVTVSPEYNEMPAFIEAVVGMGVVVSIGHTKADSRQIQDAVRAGATMSTHLGNGAHQTMRRHPNYIFDQMAEDRLVASFIADGIHLGKAFLKAAIRAKGLERSVLVTDAVMPAGCAPGDFMLGEVPVTLHADESVTLRDGSGRLAGSSLKMDRAVGTAVKLAEVSLRDAVTMATTNAARVGRIGGRLRGLQPGDRADLVEFTFDESTHRLTVERTWLSGQLVYSRS